MTKAEAIKQAEEIKYRAQSMMLDVTRLDDLKELTRIAKSAEMTLNELRRGEHC